MNKPFSKLLRIFCIPTQKMRTFLKKEMKKYPEMQKEHYGKDFLFYRGTLPVLLVAHFDTVHRDFPTVESIAIYKGRVTAPFTGLGADDRLGIFGILEMLERGHRPHVVFTDGEEVGGRGAKEFAKYLKSTEDTPKINYMIELDRMNENDAAMYSCRNQEFINHLSEYGYQRAHGTYTDICDIMPAIDRAGTNLSVGYYRQHTKDEYFVVSEYYTNMDRLDNILSNVDEDKVYTHKGNYKAPERDNYRSYDEYQRGYRDTALTIFDQRVREATYTNPDLDEDDIDSVFGEHVDECDYCLGIYPIEELKEIDGEKFCDDCIKHSLPYYKVRGI